MTPRRSLAIILSTATLALGASAQTKLLRFPDVHADKVAFCYGGDLWLAPSTGGTVNVPEFGKADARGQWAVEGHGSTRTSWSRTTPSPCSTGATRSSNARSRSS